MLTFIIAIGYSGVVMLTVKEGSVSMELDVMVSEETLEAFRELAIIEYEQALDKVINEFKSNGRITFRKIEKMRKQAAFKLLNQITNQQK